MWYFWLLLVWQLGERDIVLTLLFLQVVFYHTNNKIMFIQEAPVFGKTKLNILLLVSELFNSLANSSG